MSGSAQDHINLALALASQVTEPLKAIERRNGEYKRKVILRRIIIYILISTMQQMQFYHKILTGRDKVYAERIKAR